MPASRWNRVPAPGTEPLLSALFPPAYLLSFVTDHEGEPLHDAPDLSLYFRSRMGGALGLCFRSDTFSEGENASMAHEIDIYKATRGTVSVAAEAEPERAAHPAAEVQREVRRVVQRLALVVGDEGQ